MGKWNMYKDMVKAQTSALPSTSNSMWLETLSEFAQFVVITAICIHLKWYKTAIVLIMIVGTMMVIAGFDKENFKSP